MVDFDYLVKGIRALARAHRLNTMAGHLGAAVVAGYFVAEQNPDLDETVYVGIEGELERIIRGESVFGPSKGSAIDVKEMFAPLPKQAAKEDLVDGLVAALERNVDEPRQSGHNVIFTSIAIRALKDHPDLATPAAVDGIRKLIAGFDGKTPGNGYYGKERGRIDGRRVALGDDRPKPYRDLAGMARAVLGELIDHASERRQGFGGLTHVVNHAAGLAELARYGYRDLATKGLAAHHRHLSLWMSLPDVTAELGPEEATKHDPRSAEFWTSEELRYDRARLTHRVKTLYGFDALVELVEEEAVRDRGNDRLRYLM